MTSLGLPEGARLRFGDEMRVGLRGQVRRVWAPRGERVYQAVELGYEWAYLFLTGEVEHGEFEWQWLPNMRKEALHEAMKQLRERGVEGIVWDRAPGHRAKLVGEAGIRRIFLPPYSPELNPIERVIEELRKEVEGRVYGTLEAKQQAVEGQLAKWKEDPDRIRRLIGWDWIIEQVQERPRAVAGRFIYDIY